MKLFVFVFLVGLSSVLCTFSFDNYKLVSITPTTVEHVQLIAKWQNEDVDFDLWNEPRELNHNVQVLLTPVAYYKYKELFYMNGIEYKLIDNNIQNKINEEREWVMRSRNSGRIVGTYANHSAMNDWITGVANNNPSYISIYSAGKSLENRDMKVIKIKTATTKRSIWIDCGIHAREWIAPATCVWIIDKLVTEYNSGDPVTKSLLDYYEIHVLPSVNPDGYEYSINTYRLWRKSRTRNAGSSCFGIDLNRNYNYKWMVAGASDNPCSDTYAGPSQNSEPETKNVIAALNAKRGDWDAFLTLHSYGEYCLIPYGYTTQLPPDYPEQERVAKIVTASIKEHAGTSFTIGTSANVLYLSSGSSRDWAYADAGIKYSYTFELSPGDNTPDGSYGFVLPESRVPRVGAEIYKGVKTLFQTLKGSNTQ